MISLGLIKVFYSKLNYGLLLAEFRPPAEVSSVKSDFIQIL